MPVTGVCALHPFSSHGLKGGSQRVADEHAARVSTGETGSVSRAAKVLLSAQQFFCNVVIDSHMDI